ncbi:M67 family metallopeptidase [Paenibacillus sp. YYML68]|uniref:M67 family metallopeptidase n=1 Tax=Paenibacillus sp. YYML68 TaxID=2909250 RepID=UPI002491749D|nr:M67 family metallopeptidase [Paenibacillus sp. YYML68]
MASAKVFIRADVLEELSAYARSKWPQEACGFLFGCLDGTVGLVTVDRFDNSDRTDRSLCCLECAEHQPAPVVTRFVPVDNAARRTDRQFHMEPGQMIRALYEHPQLQLLGIMHSHPSAAPEPSAADVGTLWGSYVTHWIVSVTSDGIADVRAYRFRRQDAFTISEQLEIHHCPP